MDKEIEGKLEEGAWIDESSPSKEDILKRIPVYLFTSPLIEEDAALRKKYDKFCILKRFIGKRLADRLVYKTPAKEYVPMYPKA